MGSRPTVLTAKDDLLRERWVFHRNPKNYREEDKRRLLGRVTEILVKATFKNHYYKWGEDVMRQEDGGSIGLKATGSVSRCTMDRWAEDYRLLLSKAKVEVLLLKKYVDYVLIITKNLDWGARWDSKFHRVNY